MAAKKQKTEKRSCAAEQMRRLLAERIPEAAEFLLQIMRDEQQKPELRMKAAESILDRACGKASAAAPAQGGDAVPLSVSFEGVLEEWSR